MPRRPHLTQVRLRRPSPLWVAGVVMCCAAAPTLAGCGGGLEIDQPDLTAQERAACAALVKALPGSVSDQKRRTPDGKVVATAAWGDPPIELRCGVDTPKGFTRTSLCQTTNGTDWFIPENGIDDQSKDVVMTAVGRTPLVEVRLPAEYRPPAAAMVDLGPAIKAHTKLLSRCQ